MRISIVVAIAENGVIGRGGRLPWRIPSDLKLFRATTLGKPVIMGRKTFESIGKPLDGRANVVVTRNPTFRHDGVEVAGSFKQALALARRSAQKTGAAEIAVIGGADVFAAALAVANRIYLTRVHGSPEGDVYFPELKEGEWKETERRPLSRAPGDDFSCTLLVLDRSSAAPIA
jgi:dihydrofolate reductase